MSTGQQMEQLRTRAQTKRKKFWYALYIRVPFAFSTYLFLAHTFL